MKNTAPTPPSNFRFFGGILLAFMWMSRALFAVPGDLDLSFGTAGTVTTPVGSGSDVVNGVAVQGDGKIVVAGRSENGFLSYDLSVARYTNSGLLDASFGSSGKVVTPVGGFATNCGKCLALQSDGKVVVAGSSGYGSNSKLTVVRYTQGGTLDRTFGNTGKVTTAAGNYAFGQSVVVQTDGKILLGGLSYDGSRYNFIVARYSSAGALDLSFSGTGIVTTIVGSGVSNNSVCSIAVQSDGKILVAGDCDTNGMGNVTDYTLARYTSNGTLDASFGGGVGKVITPLGSGSCGSNSVAVQPDGKILMAGFAFTGSSYGFALVRFTSTGALDTSFGGGTGKIITAISSGYYGRSVVVQANGKILVAGSSNNMFATVRYTSTGAIDPTFGLDHGIVTTTVGGSCAGNDVTLQGDGKIVVAGVGNSDFAVARYLGDPVLASPLILTQPQPQIATAGQTVNFSVLATGSPAPTYQWQLNGGNIPGATSSDFVLNNVQLSNAGTYSVVVSNSQGTTTSSATLKVLSNLNAMSPAYPQFAPIPSPVGKDS